MRTLHEASTMKNTHPHATQYEGPSATEATRMNSALGYRAIDPNMYADHWREADSPCVGTNRPRACCDNHKPMETSP
jgi:hypothetical protein